ncbi:MAG: hypothetical protein AB9880_08005 [Christensenellales bacterium]
MLQAKQAISGSGQARKLLDAMHQEGYWLQKNRQNGKVLGDGVAYGSFGTTHFCLSYRAEMGLDRDDSLVGKAAERYLSLVGKDGDWLGHYSCLYAYNLRTYLLLGYRGDERLNDTVDLLLSTGRPDGGYLCDIHEKPGRRPQKSCIRGSTKALLAFSELPDYWQHERCLWLVSYFLSRGGIFQTADPTQFVNGDMARNAFPIIWRANLWEILYALSKMGYGRDRRLDKAWEVLESRMDEQGRWRLDWTPSQCPWKVGRPGEANKWITLCCLLAKHYAGRGT